MFKFSSSRQSSSETVDDFVMCLRQLAKHCEFADVDGEIKTQVVQTCVLEKIREKAFREALISLSDLLVYARSVEAARTQMSAMAKPQESSAASASQTAPATLNAVVQGCDRQRSSSLDCFNCGQ